MKTFRNTRSDASGKAVRRGPSSISGFTLAETVVAVLLASIMFLAIYACFGSGWGMIKMTSQDLRATQVLMQRLERIRLCDFTQVTNASVNPPTSIEYFDPKNQGAGKGGVAYTITYSSAIPASGTIPDAYRTSMFLVTVGAWWTNGTTVHNRSMQTYVARDGIQSYVLKGP